MPRSHQTFRLVLTVKLLGIMLRNRWWSTTFLTITAGDVDGWCWNCPVWSAPHASITPNFLFGSSREIVEDHIKRKMMTHHFSHYYSWRCWRMVSEPPGVIDPSYTPSILYALDYIISWSVSMQPIGAIINGYSSSARDGHWPSVPPC